MELLRDLGMLLPKITSKKKERYGLYLCPSCGSKFKTMIKSVNNKKTTQCRSCGSTKHTITIPRIYNIWNLMRSRCYNIKNPSYSGYGKRGITIHKGWLSDYSSFEKWALKNGYEASLSIDRKENDGNYDPSNCRWVKQDIQSQNTRLLRATNSSGFRGVFHKGQCKFVARINYLDERVFLGYFDDPRDGAIAYDNFVVLNKLAHPLNFKKD